MTLWSSLIALVTALLKLGSCPSSSTVLVGDGVTPGIADRCGRALADDVLAVPRHVEGRVDALAVPGDQLDDAVLPVGAAPLAARRFIVADDHGSVVVDAVGTRHHVERAELRERDAPAGGRPLEGPEPASEAAVAVVHPHHGRAVPRDVPGTAGRRRSVLSARGRARNRREQGPGAVLVDRGLHRFRPCPVPSRRSSSRRRRSTGSRSGIRRCSRRCPRSRPTGRRRPVGAQRAHDDRSVGRDVRGRADGRRDDERGCACVLVERDVRRDGRRRSATATVTHAQWSSFAESPLSIPPLKYSSGPGSTTSLGTWNAPIRRLSM